MVNAVIAKIEAQQTGLNEFEPAYQVGEQLKDICRSCPEQAELILHDLDNPQMSIVKAEKKIKEFADKHKTGSCACVPPKVADKILREFYGLADSPKETKADSGKSDDSIIDLADFLV